MSQPKIRNDIQNNTSNISINAGALAQNLQSINSNTGAISTNALALATLASGSPTPMATLTALQTAFPTGNTKNYLNLADGYLYYWNNTAWTKGWLYQSAGLPGNVLVSTLLVSGVAIDGGLTSLNYTRLINTVFSAATLLTQIRLFIKTIGTLKIKSFVSSDGINFTLRSEVTVQATQTGLNTFVLSLPIYKNGYIGIYNVDAQFTSNAGTVLNSYRLFPGDAEGTNAIGVSNNTNLQQIEITTMSSYASNLATQNNDDISNLTNQVNTAQANTPMGIASYGASLQTLTDLNSVSSLMTADSTFAIHRFTSSALNIPEISSGVILTHRSGSAYHTQFAYTNTNNAYLRTMLNGVWSGWEQIITEDSPMLRRVYHVEKDGSGDFTSLYAAIQEAELFMDSTVYVGDGIWDIIADLGSTYINSVGVNQRGIYLCNRIHLIFSSNSKVVCNYTGSVVLTQQWLSVFNAGIYGFTLENANISGSNIRYNVHDERDADTDVYKNSYINCNMYLDNSLIGGATNSIGGGLGLNGYIKFDGCIFEGVATAAYLSHGPLLTYHNSSGANSQSHISIKNCYLKNDGLIRINWYGLGTAMTNAEITGCSMGSPILSQAETSDGTAPNINVAIIEWNNIVRP